MLSELAPAIDPVAPHLVGDASAELDALTGAIEATHARTWISVQDLPIRQRQQIDADVGAALETLAPIPDLLDEHRIELAQRLTLTRHGASGWPTTHGRQERSAAGRGGPIGSRRRRGTRRPARMAPGAARRRTRRRRGACERRWPRSSRLAGTARRGRQTGLRRLAAGARRRLGRAGARSPRRAAARPPSASCRPSLVSAGESSTSSKPRMSTKNAIASS